MDELKTSLRTYRNEERSECSQLCATYLMEISNLRVPLCLSPPSLGPARRLASRCLADLRGLSRALLAPPRERRPSRATPARSRSIRRVRRAGHRERLAAHSQRKDHSRSRRRAAARAGRAPSPRRRAADLSTPRRAWDPMILSFGWSRARAMRGDRR